MSLTPEQNQQREGRLTASRVACLMSGDDTKLLNLWREMVGHPEFEPEDLDHYWPAVLGSFTEPLQLDWYEYRRGKPVTRRGEVVVCPRADWAAATLDGWDNQIPAPIECKHVGGYERRDVIIDRYQPQMHWQMLVTGTERAILSLIEGAKEPVIETIELDQEYSAELWRRAEWFMNCVMSLTPPVELAPVPPPIIPVNIYDLQSSNAWAAHSAVWLETYSASKAFAEATTELKALVPADAAKAHGHGVIATRSKAGAITIKEMKL